MRFFLCCVLIICFVGCAQKNVNLGRLGHLQISDKQLEKKPKKEIARICHSFFFSDLYREYEILSLENLIKEAKKNTGKDLFENVSIWQKSWNFAYIWQKKCLIMGE